MNEAELQFGEVSFQWKNPEFLLKNDDFVMQQLPSRSFGHHGASGAIAWADPTTGLSMVCFSTEPELCYSEEFNRLSALVIAGALQQ